MKSPTQEKLEAQRQGNIRDIVVDALKRHQGRKNMVMLVSVDLEVSDATLYRWCEDLSINIDDYRRPPTAPEDEDGQRARAKGPTHG